MGDSSEITQKEVQDIAYWNKIRAKLTYKKTGSWIFHIWSGIFPRLFTTGFSRSFIAASRTCSTSVFHQLVKNDHGINQKH